MAYLDPSEYVVYGLSADTADSWVTSASAMIEAHCRRASLLLTSYQERLRVGRRWARLQLNYGPAVQITALQVRYAMPAERGDNMLLACALTFGLPGQWITLDPTTAVLDTVTGEVQLPFNLMGMQPSDAEVSYTAGWAAAPYAVKVACAQIVKNAQATPGLNVKSSKMDTLVTQYFSDQLLDSQVRMLLRPYVAERLG